MLTGAQKHVNFLIRLLKVFARYFEADNRLFSVNLKHDLMVGINYKINLITHFLAHVLTWRE